MNEQELERWKEAARDRDADIHRADAVHAERAREAQRQREIEAEDQKRGEAIHNLKIAALNKSVWELLRCANDLRMSGVHLYEVARHAARAAVYTRHMDDGSNMGSEVFAFMSWLAEWTNHSA